MNCRALSALALLGVFLTCLSRTQGAIVKVKQGLVAGTTLTLRNGKVVHKFARMPYALPPVGHRRFKDPEPVESWPGVWNVSTDNALHCIQFLHFPAGPYRVNGQEDCLYLSVYTPKLPQAGNQSDLLDVIVFIHGGAFMFGSGFHFIPIPLMEEHDMVYVELDYRVGALGLFQRGISMSGTSLCPWALTENLPEKTKLIANYLGCPVNSSEEMIECLRTRPAPVIADAVRLSQPFLFNPFSPWGPTVDSFAKNPFLPDFPAELIKQGKIANVPWLNSVTADEGLYPAAEFLASQTILKTIDANWTSLAPHILDFNSTVPDNLKDKTAEKIRHKYLGDNLINLENHKAFVQIFSDRMFIADAERASRLQSKVSKSPVYFYYFNFRGRYSLTDYYEKKPHNFGVSHNDDTQYIITTFRNSFLQNTTEDEQKTSVLLTSLWASFAKTGKPHIPSWKPVTPNSFNYLQIDSGDNYRLVENAAEIGSRSFWDSLPFDEKNLWKPDA
ncbi:hypothetical protein M8J76_009694 [Diaphorina citri]|nr:hypothetical protein M8J76_009694 [Diaphorina citri]